MENNTKEEVAILVPTTDTIISTLKKENITDGKAQMIEKAFAPMVELLKSFDNEYAEIIAMEITDEACKKARMLRLKMVKVRTGVKEVHATQKAETIRFNKAVDGIKNIFDYAVISKEETLESIEKHLEIMEANRLKVLKEERENKLRVFDYDTSKVDLSKMDDAMFDMILLGVEKAYNDKIESDKKLAEELAAIKQKEIEDAEEEALVQAFIEKEKAEVEAALKVKKDLIDKLKATRVSELTKYNSNANVIDLGNMSNEDYDVLFEDSKVKYEKDLKDKAAAKIESDKIAKKLEEQRVANEKLKLEIKQKADAQKLIDDKIESDRKKKEAEDKAISDKAAADKKIKDAADKKLAKAPDRTRMTKWIDDIILPDVVVHNEDSNDVVINIENKFKAFKKWAKEQIELL